MICRDLWCLKLKSTVVILSRCCEVQIIYLDKNLRNRTPVPECDWIVSNIYIT